MKTAHDLSDLQWHIAGFWPHDWRFEPAMQVSTTQRAETPAVPAPVPGSVQQALLNARVIPDWSVGMNYQQCEWVENRHWVYEARLPDGWIEWEAFIAEVGHEPESLEAYVAWGQQRQADALRVAAASCKARFPKCGGFIVWMGHDSFPCTANTSVIDYEGNLKPAALALADVFGNQGRD